MTHEVKIAKRRLRRWTGRLPISGLCHEGDNEVDDDSRCHRSQDDRFPVRRGASTETHTAAECPVIPVIPVGGESRFQSHNADDGVVGDETQRLSDHVKQNILFAAISRCSHLFSAKRCQCSAPKKATQESRCLERMRGQFAIMS